ncbi:uncharacterized protein LOC136074395 [Hydra vulgaris]|uniref:Uncharacterized protein LOC136074395 n=1 Tax=Hydra vulgaris TaxID=6087 RepID=A0ABM4B1V6_HYDVU
MRVSCGYISGSDLIELASRKGDTGSMTTTNQLPFGSRVEVVSFNNNRIVGFKINNVQKNDPIQYRCVAVVAQSDAPYSFQSPITSIQVLDRPSFVNCLNGLPAVVSNQDLQITCQVVGNPTPNLYCQLLSYTGSVLNTLPQAFSLQQNITQLSFKAVQPEASLITCIASNDMTGSAVISVPLVVKHPPFAPRSFDVTPSSKTSLHLTWTKIPQNETGTEFSYYIIEYYISRLGVLNKTAIKIQDDVSSSPKMHYNLIGLITEQYTIVIYGVNSYGSGPPITKDVYPSDINTQNETGAGFLYFHIEYYITRLGVFNKTAINVLEDRSSLPKMQYNLTGLIREQYTVVIFGINIHGKGPYLIMTANPSDVNVKSGAFKSSKGGIVGAVVGVIPAIFIVVYMQ